MSVQNIAAKYRRALRNQTGATFSLEQLEELAGYGVLELIARIEAQELCPAKIAPALSEATGSISVVMERPRQSGRLPATPKSRAPLSIEALSHGM